MLSEKLINFVLQLEFYLIRNVHHSPWMPLHSRCKTKMEIPPPFYEFTYLPFKLDEDQILWIADPISVLTCALVH